MRKRLTLLLLSLTLFSISCQRQAPEGTVDTSNGPVVTEDTETVEEKELRMIQSAIADYNNGSIPDIEDSLKTSIAHLPLEITTLPNIDSLSDLTPIEDNHSLTNTAFVGSYRVNDKYDVIFKIYHPTGGYFWLNGEVEFEVDPSLIEQDNPAFAEYKNALDGLLDNAAKVTPYLHGLNVQLSGEDTLDGGYYRVEGFDGSNIQTIDELKQLSESVFTKEYLETYFYKNAFEGEAPIFKEVEGALYCLATDVTSLNLNTYDTRYILAATETEGDITVNLLTTIMNQVQHNIKEIHLLQTPDGYRLASAV